MGASSPFCRSFCDPAYAEDEGDDFEVLELHPGLTQGAREQWLCQPKIVIHDWPSTSSPYYCPKCGASWERADPYSED